MAITYINTDELQDISNNIISLASDLNDEFTSLFDRLINVPTGTQEWVGRQSLYYFRTVYNDKRQYSIFVNKLNELGTRIGNDARTMDTYIKGSLEQEASED